MRPSAIYTAVVMKTLRLYYLVATTSLLRRNHEEIQTRFSFYLDADPLREVYQRSRSQNFSVECWFFPPRTYRNYISIFGRDRQSIRACYSEYVVLTLVWLAV